MVFQVLFRHRIMFEGPDCLLPDRIGLQLLRRPDQQPDIIHPLQGNVTALSAAFPGSDDLAGIGDIDTLVFIESRPAEHFAIEEKEPVEFWADVIAVTKDDAVVAYFGLQLEGPVGQDVDLGDLGCPERIVADEPAEAEDGFRQQAVRPLEHNTMTEQDLENHDLLPVRDSAIKSKKTTKIK
jgi:hypothetical protein